MIEACCYNKELCSLLRCPIHSSKDIGMTTLSGNENLIKSERFKNEEYCSNNARIIDADQEKRIPLRRMFPVEKTAKVPSKTSQGTEKIKDKYEALLRFWNITPNSETKNRISKLSNEFKNSGCLEEIVKCENDTNCSETSTDGKLCCLAPTDSNIDENLTFGEKEAAFSDSIYDDDSLFSSDVKFGIVYTCPFCENVFSSKSTLGKHKRQHNICQYCKMRFKTLKAQTRHKKMCIFRKCMTSQPIVELKNIALSKNIRVTYKSAFENKGFPQFGESLSNKIKRECIDIDNCSDEFRGFTENMQSDNFSSFNSFQNVTVKSEPIDCGYEENGENIHDNSHKFLCNMESLIKTEPIDIVEEELLPYDLGHIKEERLDYSESLFLNSKSHDDTDNLRVKEEDEKLSYTSEDENICRGRRFSRFHSEVEESYSEPFSEMVRPHVFMSEDKHSLIKSELLIDKPVKNKHSSNEFTIFDCKDKMKNELVDEFKVSIFDSSKSLEKSCEESSLKHVETKQQLQKCKTNFKFLEPNNGCFQKSMHADMAVNDNCIVEPAEPERKNPALISSLKKSKITYDPEKNNISTKARYIRFTNKPNFNLFLF